MMLQLHIYRTCVQPLVEGFFEGYNATILAYGQTVHTFYRIQRLYLLTAFASRVGMCSIRHARGP